MANPIKASDLYQDDGALSRLEAQLKGIWVAMDELNKRALKVAQSTRAHSSATREGQKAIDESARQASLLEKEQTRLTAAYSDTNKQIQALRKERSQANRVAKLEAQLADSAEGSYNRLAAQYALNKVQLNAMGEEQRKATKEGQELEASTKEIYEEMKRLQEATGKTALNVGNYKDSVKEAIRESLGFGKALDVVSKTPLLAVITLVAAALGALFQAFKRSERGAELMARASGVVSGLMSALVGITNRLVDALIKVWEDPLGALQDFGKAIADNVTNRLEAIVELGGVLGRVLKALWSRDLEGLKNAASDAGTSLVKLTAGLDAEGQREFAEAVKGATAEVLSQAEAFASLAAARLEVARQNRELTKQAERLATQEQLAQVLADDATRSFAEREAQAEKARQALEKRSDVELRLARNNLGLIEQEIALRRRQGEDVEALLDQQLGAYQAVLAAEREYAVTVADNEKTRRELVQDRLERDLDILLDDFDNRKSINERIIADEEQALEARRALLAETIRLGEESFQAQIATLEQLAGQRIDAEALLAETSSKAQIERIRQLGLSEIAEGRILEVIRDRRTAVQDLTEAQRELTKASAEGAAALSALVSSGQQQLLEQQKAQAQEVAQIAAGVARQSKEILEKEGVTSIYDLLGLSGNAEGQQALTSALDGAKQQLADFQAQRVEFANQQAEAAQQEVQTAQTRLQAEIAAAQAGYASRVDTARAELELAEQAQKEAEKRQAQAQRAQLVAQSVQQASNLITAVSKLFAELPFFLALPASVTMFGAFAAAKIKAFQATKIFRKGGYEALDYGGSHASGRDISLGYDASGTERRAERGESLAVFNREAVARYGGALPAIVAAINAGAFEDRYQRRAGPGAGLPVLNNSVHVNTGGMETELKRIRRNGERSIATTPDGRIIERYKNKVRIYV